jgi:hypothetical protein
MPNLLCLKVRVKESPGKTAGAFRLERPRTSRPRFAFCFLIFASNSPVFLFLRANL